ncbi:MAG: c-type cytochrome [Actinomycetota bacterium]|nr:c-type cytochrome [Actinomycetota bacterium]
MATGLVAASIAVGACGSDEPDLVAGKEAFLEGCASCHTMERAGSQSQIGPNLDLAFQRALVDGFGREGIRGAVHEQILNPAMVPQDSPAYMPPEIFTGQKARNVAAYVAFAVANAGEDQGLLAEAGRSDAEPGTGAFVFLEGGEGGAQACGQCHTLEAAGTSATVGPELDSYLQGVSEEDLREDIVAPDSEIAAGFEGGVMPADYGESLSEEELDMLVEYLLEAGGGAGGGG